MRRYEIRNATVLRAFFEINVRHFRIN